MAVKTSRIGRILVDWKRSKSKWKAREIFMKRMSFTLIGCGKVAEKHLKAALAFPERLTVAGLADNRPEAAERLLTGLGISGKDRSGIRIFSDYREMIAALHPQVVAITTPSGSH